MYRNAGFFEPIGSPQDAASAGLTKGDGLPRSFLPSRACDLWTL